MSPMNSQIPIPEGLTNNEPGRKGITTHTMETLQTLIHGEELNRASISKTHGTKAPDILPPKGKAKTKAKTKSPRAKGNITSKIKEREEAPNHVKARIMRTPLRGAGGADGIDGADCAQPHPLPPGVQQALMPPTSTLKRRLMTMATCAQFCSSEPISLLAV